LLKYFVATLGVGFLLSAIAVPELEPLYRLNNSVAAGGLFILAIFILFAEGEDHDHTN